MIVPGAVLVTNTSADVPPATTVTAVALLFSSVGSSGLETVAVLVKKVPAGVAPGMNSVRVKLTLPPLAKLGLVQLTVPPEPTPGVVHDQPAGDDRLTKVIPAGIGSLRDTLVASSGPPLRTPS